MKPADWLVFIAGLLLTAALAWQTWAGGPAREVLIYAGDRIVSRLPLDVERTVTVPGALGDSVIRIADGGARFVASPCTHKLCIRAGRLDYAGAATACLPNHVSLLVTGNERRYDALNF